MKDVDDIISSTKQNLNRRSLISNHVKAKIKTLFYDVNTLNGERACKKFKIPHDYRTQKEKSIHAEYLRYYPLKDPEYIKKAKEDPKSAYQYHMNVTK